MTVRINETNTPRGRVASYVWGPDVGSGYGEYASHQKAGGMGGLCLVLDGASTNPNYADNNNSYPDATDDDYFPLMDRMGNVTGYRKAATTEAADSLSAIYEYDAFGQEIRSVGPASDKQPYRFSTKYTEGSTGLVYYGYRWYDAGKGRWINRDPIAEEGGVNVFCTVKNDLNSNVDLLGLFQTRSDLIEEIRECQAKCKRAERACYDTVAKEVARWSAAENARHKKSLENIEISRQSALDKCKGTAFDAVPGACWLLTERPFDLAVLGEYTNTNIERTKIWEYNERWRAECWTSYLRCLAGCELWAMWEGACHGH